MSLPECREALLSLPCGLCTCGEGREKAGCGKEVTEKLGVFLAGSKALLKKKMCSHSVLGVNISHSSSTMSCAVPCNIYS